MQRSPLCIFSFFAIARNNDACVEAGAGVFIKVTQSESEKCVRCWHHREDIGSNNEHPELCSRCVENVTGVFRLNQD
jgi:isoleucyl-tRNA synthetase